jgi:hypothetical protein
MHMPGLTAEGSLYTTKNHYRTIGVGRPTEGISPAWSDGPLVSLDPYPIGGVLQSLADGVRCESAIAPRRLFGTIVQSVLPMSVPGHQSDPADSSQCSDCGNNCAIATGGCVTGAGVACAACWAIPIPGADAACFAACLGAATAACYAAGSTCVSNCFNIGGPCCPVACGVGCCNRDETCLDTSQGLCCSPGTLPCPGPQESCYDPTTEKCLPSGIGCPVGQECGYNCCGEYAQCVDPSTGNCCPLLTGIPCGNQCCDGTTQRCTGGVCCPTAQACGNICCPSGYVCGPNGQCVVGQNCQPGQFLCVSADNTKQNCCEGDQSCCNDGACCGGASNPNYMCCESLGCVPVWDCIG